MSAYLIVWRSHPGKLQKPSLKICETIEQDRMDKSLNQLKSLIISELFFDIVRNRLHVGTPEPRILVRSAGIF